MNYAFTHATLLTGQKDMASQGDMTVVIRGRISDIKKLFPAPEGCTEINLAGRFLMPGLINPMGFSPFFREGRQRRETRIPQGGLPVPQEG